MNDSRLRSSLVGIAGLVAAAMVAASPAGAQSCGQWEVVPNPLFEGAETIPIMIVPFSPDSAVGLRNLGGGVAFMEWDGSAWSVTSVDPIPDLEGGTGWNMRAAIGSAPDDLWATGLRGLDNFHGVPFLARYDGVEWTAELATIFEDPNPEAGDPLRTAEGSDLVFLAPDDIWVVGQGEDLEQTVSNPVVCHWDGSSLEEVQPVQAVYSRSNYVEGADGSATDSVWIVGYGRHTGGTYHLLTHHWDGSQWTPVTSWTPLPGQTILQDFLDDVVALAADDVWAVGKKTVLIDGSTQSVSLYLHWDGTGWSEVAGPDIGPLTSLTAAGPDALWASNAFGEFGGRVARYDGTAWTEMETAEIPGATHIGLSRVFGSPAGDVWSIGYWAIYDGAGGWEEYRDLIEHFTTGCPGDVDGNGLVDIVDLMAVLAAWGACPAEGACVEDIDGDGGVDITDLLIVLSNWS